MGKKKEVETRKEVVSTVSAVYTALDTWGKRYAFQVKTEKEKKEELQTVGHISLEEKHKLFSE